MSGNKECSDTQGVAAMRTTANGWLMATTAHDMRMPLARMFEITQMLKSADQNLSHDQREAALDYVLAEERRLERLIDNVLDTARIGLNRVTVSREDVSVGDAIGEALNVIDLSMHFVVVNLDSELPRVVADPERLQQVVENLISHAMDRSPMDRPISITTRVDCDDVAVAVSDHGPAIERALAPYVFEPLAECDVETGQTRRVNLGMYVTKNLVEAMDGRIKVECDPGPVTTFVVSLPREHSGIRA